MLKGHLPRGIYHRVYFSIRRLHSRWFFLVNTCKVKPSWLCPAKCPRGRDSPPHQRPFTGALLKCHLIPFRLFVLAKTYMVKPSWLCLTIVCIQANVSSRLACLPPGLVDGRSYRVTSLIRNSAPPGPYSRSMPWALWRP